MARAVEPVKSITRERKMKRVVYKLMRVLTGYETGNIGRPKYLSLSSELSCLDGDKDHTSLLTSVPALCGMTPFEVSPSDVLLLARSTRSAMHIISYSTQGPLPSMCPIRT